MISRSQFEQADTAQIRDGFGNGLLLAGQQDSHVVAVCADLRDSIRMDKFAKEFPNRFFEVGVAEQNLVGVAAGLAKEDLIAFAGSYAAFSPGRTHDQIRVSVCYPRRNVKIVGGHAGLTVGADGATHQALEDIAMMQALPNMTVLVPSDFASARELTQQAARITTPVYLRLSRVATKNLLSDVAKIKIGQAIEMKPGSDLTIIATGVLVDRALQLAWMLADQQIDAQVLNVHTIKPLDDKTILQAAAKTGKVVTIEEHQRLGGLGATVASLLAENHPVPMRLIGVDDRFGQSGAPDELLDRYGFSLPAMRQEVLNLLADQ